MELQRTNVLFYIRHHRSSYYTGRYMQYFQTESQKQKTIQKTNTSIAQSTALASHEFRCSDQDHGPLHTPLTALDTG